MGVHKEPGKDTARTAEPHSTGLHAPCLKLVEEQRSGGFPERCHLLSQVTVPCHGALLSWDGWTPLPMGSGESVPCFALLVCGFSLPIKVPLSQLRSFLTFSILSPSHQSGVSKWLHRAEFPSGVKPQQEGRSLEHQADHCKAGDLVCASPSLASDSYRDLNSTRSSLNQGSPLYVLVMWHLGR